VEIIVFFSKYLVFIENIILLFSIIPTFVEIISIYHIKDEKVDWVKLAAICIQTIIAANDSSRT
jgi:hypothetical protein